MTLPATPALVLQLAKILGRRQAKQELRWMQDTLLNKHQNDEKSFLMNQMIKRRIAGEPLQYILGTQPFGHLELLVRKPVLIPRPETEDWTIRLASLLSPSADRPLKLLDLCTGSGCIPLLLCHLWQKGSLRAVGVDVSHDALQLAKDNAKRVNVSSPQTLEPVDDFQEAKKTSNTFVGIHADILDADFIKGPEISTMQPFDVVTSNPPYIPKHEYDGLPPSVRDYEDPAALLGDPPSPRADELNESHRDHDRRGLRFYRAIADLIGNHRLVKEGGLAVLEVGHDQSRDVAALMSKNAKVSRTEIWKDPWGVERCVLAWK
ncbi:S-adenosyl-L-methionine-dependent methyltransferase [Schizopora paradoxa]|uniref:S-adenosyl-L-methionine-dependent methyltransferase n=1 Tax=Schizopora paradoxa TaxID=27342 RepID=A0A0H2RCK6_9AGAM|nr:S-adenosyl-L-methionine-dependent methyltransferase [Schizopora paradoxa]